MATHVETSRDYRRRDDDVVGRAFFSIATPILAAVLSLVLSVIVVLTAK